MPLRLVHVTTIPAALVFLRGQPRYMRERGISEFVVTSPGRSLEEFGREEGIEFFSVPMQRRISPVHDLVALGRLWRLFRRLRPEIVDAHTPKGALLGILAAFLARVPVRIYHLHGLRFVTARGLRRTVLREAERATSAFATRVLCVSRSVASAVIDEGLVRADKVGVVAQGSINGVDAERFRPAPAAARREARLALGLPADAPVIGFVGRMSRDKGLRELADAWRSLREEHVDLRLLLVGPAEPSDPPDAATLATFAHDPRVQRFEFDMDTPKYFRAMDVVVLPTYREGFPVVPLEAAASGLPVVATRVPGCTDAIVDGVTGTLVPPRDAVALAEAIRTYLRDPGIRERHGAAARERAVREFRPDVIWKGLHTEYVGLWSEVRSRGGRPLARTPAT